MRNRSFRLITGLVPEYDREAYWDLAMASVVQNKEFISEKIKEGASYEKIMERIHKGVLY